MELTEFLYDPQSVDVVGLSLQSHMYIYIPGVTHCTLLHSPQMETRKGEEPFLFSLWMK